MDYHDAGFCNNVAGGSIRLQVPSDLCVGRHVYVCIDDGSTNPAKRPDPHVFQKNRTINFAVGIYPYAGREHTSQHPTARQDAAGGDERVYRDTHVLRLVR